MVQCNRVLSSTMYCNSQALRIGGDACITFVACIALWHYLYIVALCKEVDSTEERITHDECFGIWRLSSVLKDNMYYLCPCAAAILSGVPSVSASGTCVYRLENAGKDPKLSL